MKLQKLFFFSCVAMFSMASITTWAQCPPGDVMLNTQAQVDDFMTDYPTCTEISGDLSIGGSADITDLSPLENLTHVTGTLFIVGNATLATSNGLNIEQVDGDLQVISNDLLEDLEGLSALENVGANLQIINNSELDNTGALATLQEVGGNFQITSNAILTTIDGFSGLTEINGELQVTDNQAITNIDGLANLESINGDVIIAANPELTTIQGLAAVDPTTIDELTITSNNNLALCAMTNLCTYLSEGSNPRTIGGNTGECVDEASIEAACETLCELPTDIVEEDVTETTASFSWSEPSETFNLDGYAWAVLVAGGDTENEEDYIAEGETDNTETNVEIEELEPDTEYDFYVYSICNADDELHSDMSSLTFTTDEELSVNNNTFNTIAVYPNPAVNTIHFKTNSTINAVTVFNIHGKQVLTQQKLQENTDLDVSKLAPGIYIIQANIDGKTGNTKFIKK